MKIRLTSYDELPENTQMHFDVPDHPGALVVVRGPKLKTGDHKPIGTFFHFDLDPWEEPAAPSAPTDANQQSH